MCRKFMRLDCLTLGGLVSDASISSKEQRSRLYDKMARDLYENGAVFLKHGETSQSLSLSDIFTFKDGTVTPVLKVKFGLTLFLSLLL